MNCVPPAPDMPAHLPVRPPASMQDQQQQTDLCSADYSMENPLHYNGDSFNLPTSATIGLSTMVPCKCHPAVECIQAMKYCIPQRRRLQDITAFKGISEGCSVDTSDYIVYNPSTNKLVKPRHDRLDETFDGRIGEEGQKAHENTNPAEILNNNKSLYDLKQEPRTWTQPTNFESIKPADLCSHPFDVDSDSDEDGDMLLTIEPVDPVSSHPDDDYDDDDTDVGPVSHPIDIDFNSDDDDADYDGNFDSKDDSKMPLEPTASPAPAEREDRMWSCKIRTSRAAGSAVPDKSVPAVPTPLKADSAPTTAKEDNEGGGAPAALPELPADDKEEPEPEQDPEHEHEPNPDCTKPESTFLPISEFDRGEASSPQEGQKGHKQIDDNRNTVNNSNKQNSGKPSDADGRGTARLCVDSDSSGGDQLAQLKDIWHVPGLAKSGGAVHRMFSQRAAQCAAFPLIIFNGNSSYIDYSDFNIEFYESCAISTKTQRQQPAGSRSDDMHEFPLLKDGCNILTMAIAIIISLIYYCIGYTVINVVRKTDESHDEHRLERYLRCDATVNILTKTTGMLTFRRHRAPLMDISTGNSN